MRNKLITLSLALVLLLGATLFPFWGSEGSPARASDAPADAPWPMEAHDLQHTGRSPYSGPQVPYLKWTYQADGAIVRSPLIGSDGTIYFVARYQSFYAINPDGTLKWSYKLTEKYEDFVTFSPALGKDGTIYVGSHKSEEGKLYALGPEGDVRWILQPQGVVCTAIMIGEDGTLYFGLDILQGGDVISSYLYALNPDSSLKWRFEAETSLQSIAIGHDGTIYFVDYAIRALNPDGTFKGSYPTQGTPTPPTIGNDGTIYYCTGYGLWAASPDAYLTGFLKWRYGAYEDVIWVGGRSALSPDGTIYVWGTDTSGTTRFPLLLALDPDGNLKWSHRWDSKGIGGNFLTVGGAGTVYFCTTSGQLYAIGSDGTTEWTYQTTAEDVRFAPVIGSDGTIYFGSQEGMLYAIGDLPPSPAPKAEFSINATEARVGQQVQFTSSSTGVVTSSLWDFGDGTKLEGTEGEVSHTYLAEGSYTVSLTASNPWGSDTVSKSLLVQPAVHKGTQLLWLWVVIGVAVALALGIVIKRRLSRG
jgi:outer membrane protein assembly factor BamB